MNNLLIKFQNFSFTLNHSKNIANNQNHTIKTTHPEVLYNTTVKVLDELLNIKHL